MEKQIQLIDLSKEFSDISVHIMSSIEQVCKSGHFINGPFVKKFEQKIINYFGDQIYVIPCASGTDALFVSMLSLGISSGDEIITTPFSFVSIVESCRLLGANVRYADIDTETFNISPQSIKNLINNKTKAIIPVHLFGQSADMSEIMKISHDFGIPVIEDCAQSFGAKHCGILTGLFGLCSCFSFFPSKNLGCYGDGGMVITKDKNVYDNIRSICNHGSKKKYYYSTVGVNSRLDEIQAAILCVKLDYIDSYILKRRNNAEKYNLKLSENCIKPTERMNNFHTYNQYSILFDKRQEIISRFINNNISYAIYYPELLCKFDIYKYQNDSVPNAESLVQKIISIPIDPLLSDDQLNFVCNTLNEVLKVC